jgi:hypothetical protein
MELKFRQPIFKEDKTFSGKFYYFKVGEKCAGYLSNDLESDKSLFIFQQYIGKKDRLGIDIYVGMIVKVIEEYCAKNQSIGFYEVVYSQYDLAFKLKTIESNIFKVGSIVYFIDEVEVVGNCFSWEFIKK